MKTCPIRRDSCRPADCAWFDQNSKQCAVLLLAQRFDAITTTEDEVLVKQGGELVFSELLETDSCSHT